ncbi:MAG: hypothetical protein DLM73_08680 [Chthoniobacterales bacterium]|nr:MAG: hypothetical protein DLM73_08680 [Chthoniobacterales bacterium]
MKAYLVTTAALFALITIAHIWRMMKEDGGLLANPTFVVLTVVSAALCLWAVLLLRRVSR